MTLKFANVKIRRGHFTKNTFIICLNFQFDNFDSGQRTLNLKCFDTVFEGCIIRSKVLSLYLGLHRAILLALLWVKYLDVLCLILTGLLGVIAALPVLLDLLLGILLLLGYLDVVQGLPTLARECVEVGALVVQAEVLFDEGELVGGGA